MAAGLESSRVVLTVHGNWKRGIALGLGVSWVFWVCTPRLGEEFDRCHRVLQLLRQHSDGVTALGIEILIIAISFFFYGVTEKRPHTICRAAPRRQQCQHRFTIDV